MWITQLWHASPSVQVIEKHMAFLKKLFILSSLHAFIHQVMKTLCLYTGNRLQESDEISCTFSYLKYILQKHTAMSVFFPQHYAGLDQFFTFGVLCCEYIQAFTCNTDEALMCTVHGSLFSYVQSSAKPLSGQVDNISSQCEAAPMAYIFTYQSPLSLPLRWPSLNIRRFLWVTYSTDKTWMYEGPREKKRPSQWDERP